MKKQLVALSGIPRSGSSVLCSLLNQNHQTHATTTSPLIDFLIESDRLWKAVSGALVDRPEDQYKKMVQGIIDGMYDHIDKPVIVDKNRLWPRYGKEMANLLGHRLKIICTVRPIPEVLASYILLVRKNEGKVTFIDQEVLNQGLIVNDKNRCKILWEKFINHPYMSLKIGHKANNADILFVSYDDIVHNSDVTLMNICEFLDIRFNYPMLDRLQPMDENDAFHGGIEGLHDVRPIMKRTSPPPEEVIGHELTEKYTNMKLDFWNK